MINLLPDEMKDDFNYGRKNHAILRWLSTVMFGIVVLLIVAAVGRLAIQTARNQTISQKAAVELQLKTASYDTVNADYTNFVGTLGNVRKIYQQQILYSRLIRKLGTVLPPGAKITNISISDKDRAVGLNFDNDADGLGSTIQLNLTDQSKQVAEKTKKLFNENLSLAISGQGETDSENQTIRLYINAIGEPNEDKLINSLKSGGDLAFYAIKPQINGYTTDYDVITNGRISNKSEEQIKGDIKNDLAALPQIRNYSVDSSSRTVDFTVRADSTDEAKSLATLLTNSSNTLFIETYVFEDLLYAGKEKCIDHYTQKSTCSGASGKCMAMASNGCQYIIRAYYDELLTATTVKKTSDQEQKKCLALSSACTHLVEAKYTQLFSKVDINRVAACTKDAATGTTNCPVEMRAEFSPDSMFYLINPVGVSK